jgi:molybdopterin-binding protein
VLLVTHDVSEAVAIADRVILIEDGEVGLDLHVELPLGSAVPIDWRRWKPKSSTVCCHCPANRRSRNLFHPAYAVALGSVRQLRALSFKLREEAQRFDLQPCRLQLISTSGEINMTIKAINVRNQFKGSIKEIVLGDVLSEIDVQTASGIVTSVITTRSVKELELAVGSEVIAFVKSTEVSIAKL